MERHGCGEWPSAGATHRTCRLRRLRTTCSRSIVHRSHHPCDQTTLPYLFLGRGHATWVYTVPPPLIEAFSTERRGMQQINRCGRRLPSPGVVSMSIFSFWIAVRTAAVSASATVWIAWSNVASTICRMLLIPDYEPQDIIFSQRLHENSHKAGSEKSTAPSRWRSAMPAAPPSVGQGWARP